jgi:shikimate kinase
VGKILAGMTGKHFVEVDALIEQKAGKSIPAIFRDVGEIGFRELEIAVTRDYT